MAFDLFISKSIIIDIFQKIFKLKKNLLPIKLLVAFNLNLVAYSNLIPSTMYIHVATQYIMNILFIMYDDGVVDEHVSE